MRILGYIDHARIKITVFEDNNKIILQCEDGLCQVTFKYRKGEPVEDLNDVKSLVNSEFMTVVEDQLSAMNKQRIKAIMKLDSNEENEFPTII